MTDNLWQTDGSVVFDGVLYLEEGPSQLAKALYRRLTTYPGELPAHPEYGCRLRDYLGQPADDWVLGLVALEAKQALLQDPRVQDARVEAEVRGDTIVVTAYVTPVPGLGYDEVVVSVEVR